MSEYLQNRKQLEALIADYPQVEFDAWGKHQNRLRNRLTGETEYVGFINRNTAERILDKCELLTVDRKSLEAQLVEYRARRQELRERMVLALVRDEALDHHDKADWDRLASRIPKLEEYLA